MATRKGLKKPIENLSHWQSTPAPSRIHSNIKDSFKQAMPLSDPPSPVKSSNKHQTNKMNNKDEIKKPTMVEMICKAIEGLENGRKGSSVPAIKKWIVATYNLETDGATNVRIRKALAKGLENGVLDRSTKSAQLTGAKGFFIVKPKPKKEKPKKSKDKKPAQKAKGKPNYASDSEVTIIKSDKNKSKLYASDTDLPLNVEELKPKKLKKTEPKESKKQKTNEVKNTAKPKGEKAKPGKTEKPDSAKSKAKKVEGEKVKKEKPPVKKTLSKPKKATESEAASSGKKTSKK